MKKTKRGIAWMLIAAFCMVIALPYVKTVFASDNYTEADGDDTENTGYIVTLEDAEHGMVKFVDFEERRREYHEGDTVLLQIDADAEYQLSEISVLNTESEEEMCLVEQTEDGLFSFIVPDHDLIVKVIFSKVNEEMEAELSDSIQNDTSSGYAAVRSGGISSRLQSAIGKIRVYSDSDEPIRVYSEGMLAVNGTVAFCLNPLVHFQAGNVEGIDLLEYGLSQSEITACAMIVKYAYEYTELTENQKYLVAQCLIWRYLNSKFGWNCGNIHIDGASLEIARQGEIYVEILNKINANINQYIGEGTVYINESTQPLAQFTLKPAFGYAQLVKTSDNTTLTENNTCYSLEGAQYGVYKDSGCSQLAATLITDAEGKSNTVSLEPGNYYIKEISASEGYIVDAEVYPLQVITSQTAVVRVSEKPVNAIPEIEVYKIDKETEGAYVQGAASLENAQFKVNFYEGYYTEDNLPDTAAKTWIIKSKSTISSDGTVRYAARLEDIYKVSGDSFYKIGDDIILPLGTLSIEEIQAPVGYSLAGSWIQAVNDTKKSEGIYVIQVTQDGERAVLSSGNEYTVADRVIRGDFELTKIDKNTQKPIEGVAFKITSNTTGESHVFTTDANGHYSSRSDYAAHSYNTNCGNTGDGLWFGMDANGENVEVDDEVGALPYDTYTIEELECAANAGKSLYTGTITIMKDNYLVSLGNIENSDIGIKTTAKDEATGTHYAMAGSDVTIIDTVEYIGLIKNQTYELKGILMNRSTGEPVLDEDGKQVAVTKKITPKDSNGEVEMEFLFDASGLQGADVVVFEELYLDNKKIAEHSDMNEALQTIHFPTISTEAIDNETNCEIAKADEEITIIDTVSYENLREGRKYTIKGTLMDKETGRAVLDADGNKIEAETTFTAKTTSGTVEVAFCFNGSNLEGKTLVAFETLTRDNHEYAVHKDLKDEAQTVYIPKIGTSVSDSDTGIHISKADQEVTMIDEVEYENLVPGREYILEGMLIDQATGKTAVDSEGNKITAKTSFVPEKEQGIVEVNFKFNGEELEGETLVAYEELLYNDKSVAEHKAIDDEEQTIYFPLLKTNAVNKNDGDKSVVSQGTVTIVDKVEYKNLIPEREYKIAGTLMDQTTGEPLLINGDTVLAESVFVANTSSGNTEVEFTFNADGLGDRELVVFEKLYLLDTEKETETEIADHEDWDDKDQTISLCDSRKDSTVETVKTGDNGLRKIGVYISSIVAAVFIIIIIFRGKGGRMHG